MRQECKTTVDVAWQRAVAARKASRSSDGAHEVKGGTYALSEHALEMAGAAFRTYHSDAVGPLAVVLTPEQTQKPARLLGILASARRPMRIFTTELPARRWLDSVQ